jgi:hypothetical protein
LKEAKLLLMRKKYNKDLYKNRGPEGKHHETHACYRKKNTRTPAPKGHDTAVITSSRQSTKQTPENQALAAGAAQQDTPRTSNR